MKESISINEAATKGIERIRMPHWATPEDHLQIDIIDLGDGDKEPRLWAALFSPMNLEVNKKDPCIIPLITVDCDKQEWEEYTGTLPDSEEYKARQKSFEGMMEKTR